MIYTVTTVETNRLFPEIVTTPYDTIDKAIAAIDKIIYEQELGHEDVQEQIRELKENEFGDLVFEAADFYINLDSFYSAY